MKVLQVHELQKSYGTRKIFPGVGLSFSLQEGQKMVVLGCSGSGKSTLFKCLLGITEGEGLISMTKDYTFLTTENYFDPQLTLGENFYEYYRAYGLKHCGDLESFLSSNQGLSLNAYPSTCSFGTLRRLALYRVLLEQNSSLYLLDEPTTGSDVSRVKKLRKLLKATPSAYFIITHDKQLAYVADRVLLLSQVYKEVFRSEVCGYVRMNHLTYLNSPLERWELCYLTTKENCVIVRTKDVQQYKNAITDLRKNKTPFKSVWIEDDSLKGLIDVYF